MELIYLWVEDYKNIHKQGFNFSPRFHCEYDEEKELTIDERDDYIPDFFGKNINVTAIVGKNGSGKSGICLRLQQINEYIKDENNFEFIICFKIENDIKVLSNMSNIKSSFKIDFIDQTEYKNHQSDYGQYIYLLETYLTFLILRSEENEQLIENIFNLAIKHSNFENNFSFELTTFMRYPKIIQLYDNEEYKNNLIQDIQPPVAVYSNNPENGLPFPLYYNELSELNPNNSLEAYMINIIVKDDLCDDFFQEYQSPNNEDVIQGFYDNSSDDKRYNLLEYEQLISRMNYDLENISDTNRLLIKKYNDFLNYDFVDNLGRKFSDLSHGEKSIYSQFIKMFDKTQNSEKILIILDEPDLALHPEWQRKYIAEFMNTFSKLNKKIHLILTSHSPFLLSDIPKQNIIFLDKDENDNCKVVDGLKEKKETFGANIHTLLSDSFFMEDGLMGEFAKSKINEIILQLNDKDYNSNLNGKRQLLKTIKIIGEDFLKSKLLDMYYKKFNDEYLKEQRKKELIEQQAKIRKELDNL